MFNIKEELKKLPHTPGVYIMHEGDLILYIGKAVDLHNRVRQYFQGPKGKSPKFYAWCSVSNILNTLLRTPKWKL